MERGAPKATIRANVEHTGAGASSTRTLEVSIPQRGAIRSRIDSGPSRYFRDIAGLLKVVVFSPKDQQLVSGDPTARRSFLDATATMMFPDYYSLVQRFRQIAKQRTAVLKRLGEAGGFDSGQESGGSSLDRTMNLTELEVWTSQFIDVGLEITRRRGDVVTQLSGSFTQLYTELSGASGSATITYEPSFSEIFSLDGAGGSESDSSNGNDSGDGRDESVMSPVMSPTTAQAKQAIAQHFQRIYPGEVARGANLIGPHRDDLLVSLDGEPAREFASNGELWTMGLALKMAQFSYLALEDTPILVLDDVFAQLDETRRHQILDFASQQEQVFITVAAHSDIPPLESSTIIDVEKLAASL